MREIKGIYVVIGADYSELSAALTEARAAVRATAGDMSKYLNNALSPKQIENSVTAMIRDLSKLQRTSQLTGQNFNQMTVHLGALGEKLGIGSRQFADLQTRMLQTQAAKGAENALRNIATQAGLSKAEIAKLGAQFSLTEKQISSVQKSVLGTGNALSTVFKVSGAIYAISATVHTIFDLAKSLYNAAMAVERLNISYKNITGSVVEGNKELEFLQRTADATGQNFFTLADGYKGLLAASRMANISVATTQELFSGVSKAAADYALSSEQVSGVLYALSQIISKGKVSAEEIRRQMGDRLYGAFQLAAKAIGKTTAELDKMLETGSLMSDEFIPAFAKVMKDTFQGNMPKSIEAVNKFDEAWTRMKANISNTDFMIGTLNALTNFAKGVSSLTNPQDTDRIKEILTELRGIEQGHKTFSDIFGFGDAAVRAKALRKELATLYSIQNAANFKDYRPSEVRQDFSVGQKEWITAYDKLYADLKKLRQTDTQNAIDEIHKQAEEMKKTLGETASSDIAQWVSASIAKVYEKENKERDKEIEKVRETIAAREGELRIVREATDNFGNLNQAKLSYLKAEAAAEKEYAQAVKDGVSEALAAKQRDLALTIAQEEHARSLREEYEALRNTMAGFASVQFNPQAQEVLDRIQQEKDAAKGFDDAWSDALDSYRDKFNNTFEQTRTMANATFDAIHQGFSDTLYYGMRGQFDDIGEAWDSMLGSMERALADFLSSQVMSELLNLGKSIWSATSSGSTSEGGGVLGSVIASLWPSARGNVLQGKGISSLSSGVYTSPQVFGFDSIIRPFARGGVLAEAGPEAVLPLKRDSSGVLGVQTTGTSGDTFNMGDNYYDFRGSDQSTVGQLRSMATTITQNAVRQAVATVEARQQRGRGIAY